MELRERIVVARSYTGPPPGPMNYPSLDSKSPQLLLENLSAEGIEIVRRSSEKTVKFNLLGCGDREAAVPIDVEFPNSSYPYIKSCILRAGGANDSLELRLAHYADIRSRPPPESIDGLVSGDYGIVGDIKITSPNPHRETVNKIRRALEKTYLRQKTEV